MKSEQRNRNSRLIALGLLLLCLAIYISTKNLSGTKDLEHTDEKRERNAIDFVKPSHCFDDIYSANVSHSKDRLLCNDFGDFYGYDGYDLTGKTRYFMYSPSGGLSNQRTELEYAIMLGKTLNRVPILPKLAKHTSFWYHYADLTHESLLPVDTVFDLSRIEKTSDFVLTNMTVTELERFFSDTETTSFSFKILQTKYRQQWRGEKEILQYLDAPETCLFLKGPSMYHHWYSKTKILQTSNRFVIKPWLRRLAAEVYKNIGSSFNSVHIRLGDYYRRGRVPSHKKFFNQMKKKDFKYHAPLYIAVEDGNYGNYFSAFHQKYHHILYSRDFKFVEEEIKKIIGEHRMLQDMVGIVEQLVCVLSKHFVGTGYSNFSRYIEQMRNVRKHNFPEIYSIRDQIAKHRRNHGV